MSKLLKYAFYALAILTGLGGLAAGAVPLFTYAWARWQNPELGYYANLTLLSSAENTLLIAFLLLVVIHVSFVLGRHLKNPTAPKPPAPDLSVPAAKVSPDAPATPAAAPATGNTESPDAKLSRLVKSQPADPES